MGFDAADSSGFGMGVVAPILRLPMVQYAKKVLHGPVDKLQAVGWWQATGKYGIL